MASLRSVTGAREETGVYGWFARLFRRLFHTPDHPDRGFYRAIGAMFGIGLFSLAVGIWAVMNPHTPGLTSRSIMRLGVGVIIGPIFMVCALGALVHRWWQGPETPGRHTQD